jgi:hypothetical protein
LRVKEREREERKEGRKEERERVEHVLACSPSLSPFSLSPLILVLLVLNRPPWERKGRSERPGKNTQRTHRESNGNERESQLMEKRNALLLYVFILIHPYTLSVRHTVRISTITWQRKPVCNLNLSKNPNMCSLVSLSLSLSLYPPPLSLYPPCLSLPTRYLWYHSL